MMSKTNYRTQILNEAADIINGDRQDEYGPPLENWSCIAAQWSATSGHTFTPVDVGLHMIQVKIGRVATGNKMSIDTFRDIIGYAAITAEIISNDLP